MKSCVDSNAWRCSLAHPRTLRPHAALPLLTLPLDDLRVGLPGPTSSIACYPHRIPPSASYNCCAAAGRASCDCPDSNGLQTAQPRMGQRTPLEEDPSIPGAPPTPPVLFCPSTIAIIVVFASVTAPCHSFAGIKPERLAPLLTCAGMKAAIAQEASRIKAALKQERLKAQERLFE